MSFLQISETSFDEGGVSRTVGVPWQANQQVEVDRVLWEAICSSRDTGHSNNINNNGGGDNNNGGDRFGDAEEDNNNNNNNNNNNVLNELVMITKCHPVSLTFFMGKVLFLTNQ